jgi:hypothetical protein
MLITKEQQEAWVNAYIKERHTTDECSGFIDGINKSLSYVQEKMNPEDSMIPKILDSLKDLLLLHNSEMEGLIAPSPKLWNETVNKAAEAVYEYETSNEDINEDLELIRKQQGDLSEICYTC